MRIIVTGGAGFIGSHFVRRVLQDAWADEVHVLDALTYAGNLENLEPVREHKGFHFNRCDITDAQAVRNAFDAAGKVDGVFHFAAESHVDRSIESAAAFVQTNVLGTQNLLDVARHAKVGRFLHVSTDEVYGALPLDEGEPFTEASPIEPTSPYAASKAASDHLVLAAHRTHEFDVVVTRCSNNYGPYQFPEKFIPLFVTNALQGASLPLYGDGRHVRDWIHVDNHVDGLRLAFEKGRSGEVYNLGGECERANRDIADAIVKETGADPATVTPVGDRLAHDRRYAIDTTRARAELGFDPGPSIEERMAGVVAWYREQQPWWQRIKEGAYQDYYERMYGDR